MRTYTTQTLVPITVVIQNSWQQLLTAFSMLFRLFLVRLLLEAMLLAFCMSILGTVGISSLVSHSMIDQTSQSYLASFTTYTTILFFLGIAVVFLLYISMASILQIATIFAVSEQKQNFTLTTLFRASFLRFVPFMLTQLLMFFLITGGFFAGIFPGIGMLLFFTFVPFVIIFEKKSGFAAITRSVTLTASHPVSLMGRFVLLWGGGLAINVFLYSNLFEHLGYGIHILLTAYVNMIFWWYSSAYLYLLYKETVDKLPHKKETSLRSVLALSLCGWILVILMSISIYSFVSSLDMKKLFQTPPAPRQAQYQPKYQYRMSFGTKEI